jgi:hypothetical protein
MAKYLFPCCGSSPASRMAPAFEMQVVTPTLAAGLAIPAALSNRCFFIIRKAENRNCRFWPVFCKPGQKRSSYSLASSISSPLLVLSPTSVIALKHGKLPSPGLVKPLCLYCVLQSISGTAPITYLLVITPTRANGIAVLSLCKGNGSTDQETRQLMFAVFGLVSTN